jgi:hypothetical protein
MVTCLLKWKAGEGGFEDEDCRRGELMENRRDCVEPTLSVGIPYWKNHFFLIE